MSAFVSKDSIRIVITPEDCQYLEEDAWVDIRKGMNTRTLLAMQTVGENTLAQGIEYLKQVIVAWSFDEEVTSENIEDLHMEIQLKLSLEGQKTLPLVADMTAAMTEVQSTPSSGGPSLTQNGKATRRQTAKG